MFISLVLVFSVGACVGSVRLVERKLSELIRVSMVPSPVDVGRFTVNVLAAVLPEVKGDLGLEFDRVEVHPGPQPRRSADVELYLGGEVVARLSVKTSVSGELLPAIKRLRRSLKPWEDGLLVFFVVGVGEGGEEPKMVMAYMPRVVFEGYSDEEILEALTSKIREKARREGLKDLRPLALNEALLFEMTCRAIVTEEEVRKLKERVERLEGEIRDLKENLLRKIDAILEKLG